MDQFDKEPLVTIILPNLNTPLHYLEERVETILNQTYKDWECIVIDGFSENGSWEYLQKIAGRDKRFATHQFRKEGIYKAWNSGIALANGKYICIATSDDTMSDEFLSKMVHALESNPVCDLAHCALNVIDKNGDLMPSRHWNDFYPARYFGDLIRQSHIRMAPYDGILHCGLKTLYTSITQLLIKKSLFERIGVFLTDQGTIADFEWGMRAGLSGNVFHHPEFLASWRIHDAQATSDDIQSNPATYRKLCFFIDHAAGVAAENGMKLQLPLDELKEVYRKEELKLKLSRAGNGFDRAAIYISAMVAHPVLTLKVLQGAMGKTQEDELHWVGRKIRELNLTKNLIQEVNT